MSHTRIRHSRPHAFVAVAITILCLVIGAQSALAAPRAPTSVRVALATCSKITCNNRDPYVTKCATGNYYVVTSAPLTDILTHVTSWSYGYIQLWWSDTCQTNWIYGYVAESGSADNHYHMRTQAGDPGVVDSTGGPRYDWTNQWYTAGASACGTMEISYNTGGPNYTRYHAEVSNPGYSCPFDNPY